MKILVQTGYGYYKDKNGHIVCKSELPLGTHELDYDLVYVEVEDKQALDLIEVWCDPIDAERRHNEQKIADKIRKDAIEKLKDEGELPEGYE